AGIAAPRARVGLRARMGVPWSVGLPPFSPPMSRVAQGLPLKAFGNWRAKFKAEPQPPPRKLLYRRGGLSHTLSHSPSHTLWSERPVVPPARDGHRRRFSEADKRRILEEAAEPNASLAKIARRYGIARRVLCRWKQELA